LDKFREKQVLQNIKSENEDTDQALTEIYREYFPVVTKMILQKGGSTEEAKDTFQDSLIALYQLIRRGQFREDASIKTVLYAIARNLWHDKIRKMKKLEDLSVLEKTKGENDISFDFEEHNQQKVIRGIIGKLSSDCRRIILLFYYQRWSMEMIKEEMNISSVKVTKNKKYRCMQQLSKLFKDSNIDQSTFN